MLKAQGSPGCIQACFSLTYTGDMAGGKPLLLERDLAVPMRDGTRLFVNLFRPVVDRPLPVILSVTPYGKDTLPDRWVSFFMRLAGVRFGKVRCSRLTGFESPDPVLYREFAFHGGIPETRFVTTWFKMRIQRGRNRRFPLAEDFLAERDRHGLDDDYWAMKRPLLEQIQVPALVCASWSDQGLHTRGSIVGFERIASEQKWLFTHGRKKWATFYSDEALALQKRFLDHFLLHVDNGQERAPRIRLEVRKAFYQQDVRHEERWPLPSVEPLPLYLCAHTGRLQAEPVAAQGQVRYRPARRGDRAALTLTFDRATELVGSMRLRLWVSTSEGDDLDLFVVLHKLDAAGREVFFSGYNGYRHDAVAKGWLRASHRALDPGRSTPLRPWHPHTPCDPFEKGQLAG
jgi:uncharacterized protein